MIAGERGAHYFYTGVQASMRISRWRVSSPQLLDSLFFFSFFLQGTVNVNVIDVNATISSEHFNSLNLGLVGHSFERFDLAVYVMMEASRS